MGSFHEGIRQKFRVIIDTRVISLPELSALSLQQEASDGSVDEHCARPCLSSSLTHAVESIEIGIGDLEIARETRVKVSERRATTHVSRFRGWIQVKLTIDALIRSDPNLTASPALFTLFRLTNGLNFDQQSSFFQALAVAGANEL